VERKLENQPAVLILDLSENTNLDFVLFYKETINKIFVEISPILLILIEFPVTRKPIMCMMN
jgi:hypothetical protein